MVGGRDQVHGHGRGRRQAELRRRIGHPDDGAAELSLLDALGADPDSLSAVEADLGDRDAPHMVIERTVEAFGAVDALIVNHAHGSGQSLDTVTAEELDRAWAVNVRSSVLLAREFAERHDDRRADGRIVFLTSGQHLGPMPGELPYVLTKAAVQGATRTIADELAGRGITVNAVNPGPVDSGWPTDELRERLRPSFPSGRWNRPDDVVPLIAWVVSPDSASVTGQTIDAEGGFRRGSAR
ncbi:MAG: SDR family oxidoreductase [Actinobacteria bacterium]|nr:SDR family oxidoreductase [Actinomycetota bacterium]